MAALVLYSFRFVLKLFSDGSIHLHSGTFLGARRLSDFGSLPFGWTRSCFAPDSCGLDVEVRVALLENCEAFLNGVDFGVRLECDLAGVDLVFESVSDK